MPFGRFSEGNMLFFSTLRGILHDASSCPLLSVTFNKTADVSLVEKWTSTQTDVLHYTQANKLISFAGSWGTNSSNLSISLQLFTLAANVSARIDNVWTNRRVSAVVVAAAAAPNTCICLDDCKKVEIPVQIILRHRNTYI